MGRVVNLISITEEYRNIGGYKIYEASWFYEGKITGMSIDPSPLLSGEACGPLQCQPLFACQRARLGFLKEKDF
ncbi:hypothetical protein KDJ56_03700 [Brevibacillus composti]|uniref:Uncharacterized protein n=1 Tax=Brevibacillus composti TaxID=2796470 RepID=A0A7T5JPG4_9BACL|nr:hypothetical protein [Brevibacillus composti]QQE75060.1 hypothetical protein JD108_03695 [Brevibacillus composti]QUO42146.1 hypothetical protein KDJ56_03700 [Brevibacillus composti]